MVKSTLFTGSDPMEQNVTQEQRTGAGGGGLGGGGGGLKGADGPDEQIMKGVKVCTYAGTEL